VQECLDSSVDKLKMLPDSRLALALEDFVEKQVIAVYKCKICILYSDIYTIYILYSYTRQSLLFGAH
jgi:hypothetical protein